MVYHLETLSKTLIIRFSNDIFQLFTFEYDANIYLKYDTRLQRTIHV